MRRLHAFTIANTEPKRGHPDVDVTLNLEDEAVPNPRRTTYFTFTGSSVRLPDVALPAGVRVQHGSVGFFHIRRLPCRFQAADDSFKLIADS